MRQQTWFACIACVLAVMPAILVGGVAVLIFQSISSWHADPNSDFLYLRTLFGIEAPGVIINYIFFRLIPVGMQGAIAGSLAIWMTAKVYKGPKIDIAAYVTGALYTGVTIALTVVAFILKSSIEATVTAIEQACQLVGLWGGLLAMAESEMAEQRRRSYLASAAKPAK